MIHLAIAIDNIFEDSLGHDNTARGSAVFTHSFSKRVQPSTISIEPVCPFRDLVDWRLVELFVSVIRLKAKALTAVEKTRPPSTPKGDCGGKLPARCPFFSCIERSVETS